MAVSGNQGMQVSATTAEWATGLCGCCSDCGATVDFFCCFPCAVGHANKPNGEGMDMTSCFLTFCFPICGGWFTYQARKEVRARLNIINDSDSCDCPISCCCPLCALVQQKQTLAHAGQWYGSTCTDAKLVDQRDKIPVAGQMGAPVKQGV